MALDHIALIVTKEENLKFYEKLGFREKTRIIRNYDTVVIMEHDEIILEIFVDSNHPERVEFPEQKGLRHIAFGVNDLSKIDIPYGELRNDWFGRKYVFIKDPDGQPIEIIEKN
jgi:glyoxylase I family protein